MRAFDVGTSTWSLLKSFGKAPVCKGCMFYLYRNPNSISLLIMGVWLQVARGGQSVTLVGSNLVMFGGEDSKRRLLNDLNILDLETMTWDAVEAV